MSVKDMVKKTEAEAKEILEGKREEGGFARTLEAVEESISKGYETEKKETSRMMEESDKNAKEILAKRDGKEMSENDELVAKAREEAVQQTRLNPDGKIAKKIKEIEDASDELLK